MSNKWHALVLGLCSLLAALSVAAVPAQETDPPLIIRGIAFMDADGDGLQGDAEEGVAEAVVEISDGSEQFVIVTDGMGAFYAEVSAGSWIITLQVPDGYGLKEAASREVVFVSGGDPESIVLFALHELTVEDEAAVVPEGNPLEQEGPADESEGEFEEWDPSTDGAEAIDDDEGWVEILPESGALVQPLVGYALLAASGLGVGSVLVVVGRRLARQ